MYLFWITTLTFLAVLSLMAGIYLRQNRSSLIEYFHRVQVPRFKSQPFLDSLWQIEDASFHRSTLTKIAYYSAVMGAVLGIVVHSLMGALVLSLLGFALGPRIYGYVYQERFRKQFNSQYPQVVSSLASSQRAGGTLLDSIRYVATEFPTPIKEVFGQIALYTENNMPLFKSIHQVANDYKLSELHRLADAVRIIQELGGGEKAAEILEDAAEGIHWQRRCEQQINAGTTKIRQTGLIATVIPVLLFVYFAMDPHSEYRMALYDPASQVWLFIGAMATLSGWGITQLIIKKAKEL